MYDREDPKLDTMPVEKVIARIKYSNVRNWSCKSVSGDQEYLHIPFFCASLPAENRSLGFSKMDQKTSRISFLHGPCLEA